MKTFCASAMVLTAYLAISSLVSGQTAVAPKVEKNAPHPSFDISPEEAAANQHYNQPLRPQFHYTPIQGFVGDATGLIYDNGTYHLFYMSDKWERRKNRNKRWGYATSSDLLHWSEKPSVLDPIHDNKPGSGSGIVDWDNTLGLQTGRQKTLVVYYTDYKTGSCILYSTNGGVTWTRHPQNPVLPRIASNDRDPTVFWHPQTKQWRMIRHEEPFNGDGKTGFVFFGSTNLLDWTFLSRIGDFNECADFFELPVRGGRRGEKKWVLMDAGYNYKLGSFDGTEFKPESEKLRADYGAAKFAYAPQTWKKTRDGKTPPIQMGFLHYPKGADLMPMRLVWHGQMTFPCEITLKQFAEGPRICREPIKAIEKLYGEKRSWRNLMLKPGENPLADLTGDTLDIRMEIELDEAAEIIFNVRGELIRYSRARHLLEIGTSKIPLRLAGKTLRLRVLLDRASIEVFADENQVSFSKAVFFDAAQRDFSLSAEKGGAQLKSLTAHQIKSIWDENAKVASAKR
ncbi:MAG TPA: glycoside hydrolase family 32 protein [Verrucomicrobiae bacterium]|nr:glycoside hydrolase family 32 protein [Verrucomicrobiae bacterium]